MDDFGQSNAPDNIFSRGATDPGNQSEDAYEAALRAADALFSPSPKSKPASTTAPRDVSDTHADFGAEESEVEAKSGGRVLRAIDETPLVDFTAMEIEHAPKKRGRKPGSKNKPKVLVPVRPLVVTAASMQSQNDDQDEDLVEDAMEVIAEPKPEPARLPMSRASLSLEPRSAPYAWVRKNWRQANNGNAACRKSAGSGHGALEIKRPGW